MDETEITKVIEHYGIVLEEISSGGPLWVYDERHLPYPKSVIRNALYLMLREYPYELWKKLEGGEKGYNSLLIGLYSLVQFQKDLGDWQIRIPDPEKEDLSQLDAKYARSLINYIDTILYEINETMKKLERLNIKIDPQANEVGMVPLALVLNLHEVRLKLKGQS